MSFGNFVVDNWSVIGPIVKGVAASFLAFKTLNSISGAVGKVKQLIDVFKGLQGVSGLVGKVNGLASAFKSFGGIAKLVASPFTKWALIIGAVIAVIALLVKNADKIKAAFDKLGQWIIDKIQPAVDWLNGVAALIRQKFSEVIGFFQELGGKIVSAFQTLGNNIGSFFSGVWDGLVSGFKGVINFFIKGINALIGGANKLLSVKIPDWLPGGGKTVGIQLPTIPLLAKGGVATKPTLAMVGEGKEHEAILPLSKLQSLLQNNSLAATMSSLIKRSAVAAGGGGGTYHYSPQINFYGGDKREHEEVLENDKKRFDKWAKEREEYDRRTRIKPKK